ncbi:MAG: OPT/YSL family transporter [Promethearchaeota archaeon]
MGENLEKIEKVSQLGFVLTTGILLGLVLNWLSTYMIITMGFVGFGIGPTASLIIAKLLFKKRGADNRSNLTIVAIAFSATAASESAISLLFLIWMFGNASIYDMPFEPPNWFLPSIDVISAKNIFSSEWILPLFTHYFIMIVPGFIGLIIGWVFKDKFIKNKEYLFPGALQVNTTVDVLTEKSQEKGKIFMRWAIIGFILALCTLPIFVLDFSSSENGFILGIFLGPIGITLLSAGFIMNRPKISIGVSIFSILAYSVLSIFLIGPQPGLGFFEFFNFGVQNTYFSFGIGFLLGGMLFGPLIWVGIKIKIKKKKERRKVEEKAEIGGKDGSNTDNQEKLKSKNVTKSEEMNSFLRKYRREIILLSVLFVLCCFFVLFLDLFQGLSPFFVFFIMLWILILGTFVNGYLITHGSGKMGMGVSAPFIFSYIPIYFADTSGLMPYLAVPLGEPDGARGIVFTQKLASLNNIRPKTGLIAYLAGYLASTITSPLFSLLLWNSFGIGTELLPAPSFPVNGAIAAAFASNDVTQFLILPELFIAMAISLAIAYFSSDLAIGVVIGIFFPPHMALMMTLGGLIRLLYKKKVGEKVAGDKGITIATGLAVGASFVILIQIILVWFL